MMTVTSVLLVVSAADHWTLRDGTRHPTGFWAEELVEPHRLFTAAGWRVTVATPGGVAPTVDPLSLRPVVAGTPGRVRAHRAYLAAHADEFGHPRALADVDVADYDVVFYPGGHGPMEDLAQDAVSGALLTRALRGGTRVALLCHAPAAALAAVDADGGWPFAGYTMTALSNREERLNSFARKASWLLEDRLVERGARYVKGRLPLRPFVTVDRNLYTGQNPASSRRLARRLIADVTGAALAVRVSRVVPAPPDRVYAVLSDITTMGERSPETYAAEWIEPGRRFRGRNRIGRVYRWSTVATVTEADPGRTFAFTTSWPSSSTWRYDLAGVEGGTLVTESMTKARPQLAPVRLMQHLVGVHDRPEHLRAGMAATLERLELGLRRADTGRRSST